MDISRAWCGFCRFMKEVGWFVIGLIFVICFFIRLLIYSGEVNLRQVIARDTVLKEAITEALQNSRFEERNSVYAEAIKHGYGEWVVVDDIGATEFRWINKKEKE